MPVRSAASHTRSIAGSSSPWPAPVVPIAAPRMCVSAAMRASSAAASSGFRGSSPMPYRRPRLPAASSSIPSLIDAAAGPASSGPRKSSHGLAGLSTETAMPCLSMKASLRSRSQYSLPIGRPAAVLPSESSPGRISIRSCPARLTMRGTEVRARSSDT